MNSIARSRALPRVRTRSTCSTLPLRIAMIGLTLRSEPMTAWAPLIRPPRRRYSRVSRQTIASTSRERSVTSAATSAPERPVAARSRASIARRAMPKAAVSESTTWISRSGSISRARLADLNVPDRLAATLMHTTDVGPGGEGGLEGVPERDRTGRGRLRERRIGRDHPLPEGLG